MINKNFIKNLISVLIIIACLGCRLKTYKLNDNITEVPLDSSAYKSKLKFDRSLLTIIDTSVVYEQYSVVKNVPYRTDDNYDTEYYGVYKFYSNGCLNYFVLTRDDLLDSNTFNPEFRGYRGVYYKEKDKVRYDLFATSNELRHIGKLSGTFTIYGNILYDNGDTFSVDDVFITRRLPMQYLNHAANW